jgi:ribokinase
MHDEVSLYVLGSLVVACSAKVERFPMPGEAVAAEAFTVEIGGKGFNVAVGAQRLGVRVGGLLAIGDDALSHLAEQAVLQAGLPGRMLRRFPGVSGAGVGLTDRRGETSVAVFSGANRLLSGAEVAEDAAAIRSAPFVMAQFETGDGPIEEAFALARSAGGRTVLNPSPFRPVSRRILRATSIIVCNRVEASCLAQACGLGLGSDGEERLAEWLMREGVEIFVVTHGGEGAVAYPHGGPPIRQAALPVEVVDTLGAGDAFTAGLLSGLIEGRSLQGSLERAAACAALVCAGNGVLERLPDLSKVHSFLSPARRIA